LLLLITYKKKNFISRIPQIISYIGSNNYIQACLNTQPDQFN